MIAVNVWVQSMFISVISVFAPQPGLDDSQKDHFYDILGSIVSKSIKGQGSCCYSRRHQWICYRNVKVIKVTMQIMDLEF